MRPHGPHERGLLRREVRRGDLAALRGRGVDADAVSVGRQRDGRSRAAHRVHARALPGRCHHRHVPRPRGSGQGHPVRARDEKRRERRARGEDGRGRGRISTPSPVRRARSRTTCAARPAR